MSIWVTDGDNYLTADSCKDKLCIKIKPKDVFRIEVCLDKEDVEELVKLCEIHLERLSKG